MMYLRSRKGFSLLELLIALSILLILTGAAFLYLGDILFKAKVAKAANDLEVIVAAVVLHDAENPSMKLDTGLPGTKYNTADTDNLPFQTIQSLVGTYLLNTPVDPWGGSYVANSYAGYVKSLASDYKIAGTSKYDKDIMAYYLPENLFVSKVRAEDINGSSILDTGDEITLYFSKSVRTTHNVAAATAYGAGQGFAFYDEAAGAAGPAAMWAQGAVFTPRDLLAFQPGDATTYPVCNGTIAAHQIDDPASATEIFQFPADVVFRSDKFTDRLVFQYPSTSFTRAGGANLDIGTQVYIKVAPVDVADQDDETVHEAGVNVNYSRAYAIWESTIGYQAYKTVGEKNLVYLKYPKAALTKEDLADTLRTIVWKDIVD